MKNNNDFANSAKNFIRKPKKGEEIVITGISGKFPDSHNIYHFRDNLYAKVDMVTDDHRRWTPFHPEIPQRSGKMFDIEKFDLGFFGVTKVQGDHMDPMLRMLLEKVYEAIVDAGHSPADFAGTNTAVIVGFAVSTTENKSIYKTETEFSDTITGTPAFIVAGRISYYLKLKGPSFTADTACSSSMYAVEEAYRKLLEGKCEKAIVATSNLCVDPIFTLQFSRLGSIGEDGTSKSFDNAASGYVRSEAVGVILLEKAKDAKRIYAEILHSKVNCDGYKSEGITFPSSSMQQVLLKELYEEVEVDPTTLTFMEAHATGTKVGDLEELNSLDEILCRGRNSPLLIGSVKSNIGHTETASGFCSIVKTIICMETGIIPPNLHYKEPKRGAKGLEEGRMVVVTDKTPLPDNHGLFGVASFGFGGTNAQLLLHWNTKSKMNAGIPADNLPRLICVHGRTEETVTTILNDVGGRPLDAEHIYLIHQAFRKQEENNLYRGYGLFTKLKEVHRSVKRVDIEIPKLSFVFSNFDEEWLKLGHQLLDLPIFCKTMKRTPAFIVAGRISYYLKLKGPSFTADTACSSSMYAVEEAYRKLLEGKCEKAIVATSNLCVDPIFTLQFSRLGSIGEDGTSKSFDNAASGYVRSEAVGVILLEKAKDAKRIYAEILHSKVNCDGYKSEGITFPSSSMQQVLLKELYEEVEVDPTTLTFMEAHATGTKVGDLEELNSLDEILCRGRNSPLLIGSVKSNIGHTETASGFCSIVKTIICMETGIIPPNLHYKEPKRGAKGLEEGRMVVVTDKTPLPDNHGLFGVASFGFGGTNAQLLLHWNTKSKMNAGIPADNLPRLICVHGRTEETVTTILNDVGGRPLDAEHIYLIHQAFRKQEENNLYRGYGLFTKLKEVHRSVKRVDIEIPKLSFVFSNFDEEWLKLGHQLLDLPIFCKTMKRIQSILHDAANIDLSEIIKHPAKGNLTNQILGTVAVQISLSNVFKSIKLTPDQVIGFGSGELVAAYVNNYITLDQAVLGILYVTSCLNSNNSENWKSLEKILLNGNKSYVKRVPIKEEKFIENSTKYFLKKVLDSINTQDVRHLVLKDTVPLIIGANTETISDKTLWLTNGNFHDPIINILCNLGRLYQYGFDMELDKLYPNIELPVSRGTPMISPLIKWQQTDCHVYAFQDEAKTLEAQCLVHISSKSDDWKFIVGHVIDGRNLFPAAGYLFLVWECFALKMGLPIAKIGVVFDDVKFLRAANIPKDATLELRITIRAGTNTFEIAERDAAIVIGRISMITDEQTLAEIPGKEFDESNFCMDEKDIYKELRLRGYQFTGIFRSIKKSTVDVSQAIVHWDSNWVAFLDNVLQFVHLQTDTRNLYVPIGIGQLIIDAPKHEETCIKYNNMIPVRFYKDLNVIRTEGIEVRGLTASVIGRRKGGDPILEISKFIPNETHVDVSESVRIFVQIVLENTNAVRVKVVEVPSVESEELKLLCPMVQKALDDCPSVKQNLTILTNKNMKFAKISVRNKPFNSDVNCLILIVCKILESREMTIAINAVKGAKGYIISREDLGTDLSKFNESPFNVVCSHKNSAEMLVLLRPINKSLANTCYLNLTNAIDDLQWIIKLQNKIKNSDTVIVYTQNEDISGLLGLSICLQHEYGSKIKSVLIMDNAPNFDPDLEFYRQQLNKDMATNIWRNGVWGTYRHLPLSESPTIETEHAYVNVTRRGDLSSLTWLEGNIKPDILHTDPDKEIIYVYYAALNFRDVMLASGKTSPDTITPERIKQECILGIEFVGRNSKGKRVMGLCAGGALASVVLCDKCWIYEIPEEWTMEDASTTYVAYMTVLQVFHGLDLKHGRSILIHSATGGVGLAAINLSIYYGLNVFVTAGTSEKRNFLRNHYPQIETAHIGNSRDTSFEAMVDQHTHGRGVDYVLNSLTEEKLLASVRCLAKSGHFLEIGKFDLSNNNDLSLHLLQKDAHFSAVTLNKYFASYTCPDPIINNQFHDLVKKGAVKPLPRTVYNLDKVEQAFRFMALGKHIGKVVIKIRNEENDRICPVPRTLFRATKRFVCNPSCSYLVCGGLGGFGLELADFLVIRGAKNLILTSASGVRSGYQKYRIRIWKSYGVNVLTTTLVASAEEAQCMKLLKRAIELAPLDGIFNLAVVLKDALFENQTEESFKETLIPKAHFTKNLDVISRKLCPDLRYFVVFSSKCYGRGNIGKTNYALANSVMESICENRKKEGYPALAIQWGAIGEIGVLAQEKEENKELIGGTIRQRISSCLQIMDTFLTQKETIVSSMIPAGMNYENSIDNIFDAVLNIMGIANVKSVSMHLTLPELGMDSVMAAEIKQTLEQEFDMFLTPQDIRGMTLSKLAKLSNNHETEILTSNPPVQVEFPETMNLLLHYFGIEKTSLVPVMRMKTLKKDDEMAPHIFLLPGVEGMAEPLVSLCQKLQAHASCLQFCSNVKIENVTQLARSVLPYIDISTENLIILAYSFGCVVAIELLRMLEAQGKQARVIFLDGSPDIVLGLLNYYFSNDDENLLQAQVLSFIMMRYMSNTSFKNYQRHLIKLNTFQEKISYMIDVLPSSAEISTKFITEICIGFYERIDALYKYKLTEGKLKSRLTLFKASSALIADAQPDYGLSNTFENLDDVITVEGNHATIVENEQLHTEINKILTLL